MNDIATGKPTAGNSGKSSRGGRRADGKFKKGNKHQFKPGESGNPDGRPTGAFGRLSREINDKTPAAVGAKSPYVRAAKHLGFDPKKITIGELLVHSTKVHALAGKAPFLVEDNNRREGRQADVAGITQNVRIVLEVDPGPKRKRRRTTR